MPQCPVSFKKIDENRIRLNALFVFLIALCAVFTQQKIFIIFLMLDFFLRVFDFKKYSLVNIVSGQVIKIFTITQKPVDEAPKKFAASMGLFFVSIILICLIFKFYLFANILNSILIAFAALESFFSLCAGCYVYTFLKNPKVFFSSQI
jgi:Domain of unknown function (DUF4395)